MQTNTKKDLREKILTLLRNQEEQQRLAKSLIIQSRLFKMQEFKQAETILFYASFDGEVETFEMMKKAKNLGKRIGLPRIIKDEKEIVPALVEHLDDLEKGPYGIDQPCDSKEKSLKLNEIDMVIVPGVAFDRHKNRLGRGQGYYDRFLKKLPSQIPTVGLAFDFQLVEEIPTQEEYDEQVSHVLTG